MLVVVVTSLTLFKLVQGGTDSQSMKNLIGLHFPCFETICNQNKKFPANHKNSQKILILLQIFVFANEFSGYTFVNIVHNTYQSSD